MSEISRELGISKSTASRWVRNIVLDKKAQNRLNEISNNSFNKSRKTRRKRKKRQQKLLRQRVKKMLNLQSYSKGLLKIFAALLFWGEGNKSGSYMAFINSDPDMIAFYLDLLRRGFEIDESKFRALIHLHEYHDKKAMKEYWSKITQIPINQFSKSYIKPHTGKRKRQEYKGSVRIRYYDSDLEKEMREIYTLLPAVLDK